MEAFTKDGLLALDPDVRAFTLVGAYLGYFALLEAGINDAVSNVLEIKGLRAAIVTRNMSFDDKLKTLRALVAEYILDKKEAKAFDDLAKRAKRCGESRNIIAHTPFRRSAQSDGVEFFATSATNTFKYLDMDWTVDEFLRQIGTINEIDNALRSIGSRMSIQRIAEALMRPPQSRPFSTMGGLFGLAPTKEES
ncbi:hypothetical protein [Ensifer adhaerens]|uniref:hypothetical protein n=1 Tax=Ensifer adhaerens TaxID=106592 RepID=UPI001178AED5|nr:hypothetical protein [Ensifer adhaerens]